MKRPEVRQPQAVRLACSILSISRWFFLGVNPVLGRLVCPGPGRKQFSLKRRWRRFCLEKSEVEEGYEAPGSGRQGCQLLEGMEGCGSPVRVGRAGACLVVAHSCCPSHGPEEAGKTGCFLSPPLHWLMPPAGLPLSNTSQQRGPPAASLRGRRAGQGEKGCGRANWGCQQKATVSESQLHEPSDPGEETGTQQPGFSLRDRRGPGDLSDLSLA